MDTLVLDGKSFMKASKAARDLGYTADYVGQLCRSGKVPAHLVGRTWYVDAAHLGEHRVEKKRMARVKAREQAHKALEEHRLLRIQTETDPKPGRRIAYAEDRSELIPKPRKLTIASEYEPREPVVLEETADPFIIENKGEKILMEGKIKIFDANDDALTDPDTIILHPKIQRKHGKPEVIEVSEKKTPTAHEVHLIVSEEIGETEVDLPIQTDSVPSKPAFASFADRLESMEDTKVPAVSSKPIPDQEPVVSPVKPPRKSIAVPLSVIFLAVIIIVLSFGVGSLWQVTTSQDTSGLLSISYYFETQSTINFILSKI